MPVLQISRTELLNLVWSKTTRDVAKHLGMSDTGVAKLCDRNKVERPPRGYWLRKHQRKQPPPLKGQDAMITSYLPGLRPKPTKLKIDIPSLPANARLHKEILRCRGDLKSAKSDEYGRLISKRRDLQVSRKSLSRALQLLNQIVLTAIKVGFRVDASGNCIQLIREDVSMGLNFYENSTRSRGKVKYGSFEYEQQIFTPSGKLKFSLVGVYVLSGMQTEWIDRQGKPLESQIVSIMDGVMQARDGLLLHQMEQLERERLHAIAQRLKRRKALIGKLLRDRQLRVNQLIDNWQRSNHISQVMDKIEAQGSMQSAKERRLIRWARELARHYDPLDKHSIDALKDAN